MVFNSSAEMVSSSDIYKNSSFFLNNLLYNFSLLNIAIATIIIPIKTSRLYLFACFKISLASGPFNILSFFTYL